MREADIQTFWQTHPCGQRLVEEQFRDDYETFFRSYDAMRYAKEAHILECLDAIHFKNKSVLEIGIGQGSDSEQLIRRGANWSGLDITEEAVQRVTSRLTARKLAFNELKVGSVLDMDFPDKSFDLVFSHGVLHHVPDIVKAQSEIWRVLKPDGELVVMVYAKWSFNYLVAIALIRRALLLLCYGANIAPSALVQKHIDNARRIGLLRYLRMENFIHANTDGPENPFSRVYDRRLLNEHFPDFNLSKVYKRFMHAPPLPIEWLPLEKLLGWHLWAHFKPRQSYGAL